MKKTLALTYFSVFLFSSSALVSEELKETTQDIPSSPENLEQIAANSTQSSELTDDLEDAPSQVAEVVEEAIDSQGSIEDLRKLVDSLRFEKAFELGQTMLFDYEGEPDFDLLYGSSALEIGEVHEAIYTFERLVEQSPENSLYRLELARAYYENGERDKAEENFQSVLAAEQELPETVEANILAYLEAINSNEGLKDPAKAESFKGFLGLAAGYDSNVNSASDTDIIRRYFGSEGNPGFIVTSENGAQDESAAFLRYQAAGAYAKPLGEKSVLDLKAYFSQRKNGSDQDATDSGVAFFELGNRWRINTGILNLSLRYAGVTLGGDELYNHSNFRIAWAQPLAWEYLDSYSLGVSTGAIRYSDPANETRDINPSAFDVSVTKQVNKFVHTGGILIGSDAAQGEKDYFDLEGVLVENVPSDHYSRDFQGINYSLTYLFSPKAVFFGQFAYTVSSYKDVDHDFFNDAGEWSKRDGDQSVLTLGTEYKWTEAFRFRGTITAQETTSDIELYEYSRNSLEMGAGYHF